MSKGKFYITTAISYPNGPPHIGHAYEAIAADAFARFKRLDGYEVYFVTGTDEHGQKIYREARAQNTSPQELTERLSRQFKAMCDHFSISYDYFIRTSQEEHHRAVQHIWQKIEAKGDIYKDVYAGWYAPREEEFYTESELVKDEQGDWATPSGAPVEWVEEESYFFRLSAYQERLLEYHEKHPYFIKPRSRRNEVISFVKGGLKDLSISRSSFNWGVKVPKNNRHIVYVWLDALTNYLTAVGYPDENKRNFWPADLHIIGKDILRFHTVYWPAFLMSADLPIPECVFAHGMILTGEGKKMSKSLGNALDPFELAETYGIDSFRFFLLRDVVFGADGICSDQQIIHRLNADLANNLGNLAQRSLTMLQKDWDGLIPPQSSLKTKKNISGVNRDRVDERLMLDVGRLFSVNTHMEKIAPSLALSLIFRVLGTANYYFAEKEPWKLAKTDRAAQGDVLYIIIDVLRRAAILLQPFMPNDMKKLLDYLGVDEDKRDFASLDEPLEPGKKLPAPAPLFPRYKKD